MRLILGETWHETTKKPTSLIGSFALFLAVPTGLEPAICTKLIGETANFGILLAGRTLNHNAGLHKA